MKFSRRKLLCLALALPGLTATPALAQLGAAIHVYKGRGCGCCTAWVEILKKEGFAVTDEQLHPADLIKLKIAKNVPNKLFSCHTAEIDGYIIEGHVPPADIRRLISEKPDALGLGVPGMPYGSPGMGPESEREAYDVFVFGKGGESKVFTHYEAGS